MEISQEVTLERQAFNARTVIHNGLAGINLTDVSVTMNFTTGSGDQVPCFSGLSKAQDGLLA